MPIWVSFSATLDWNPVPAEDHVNISLDFKAPLHSPWQLCGVAPSWGGAAGSCTPALSHESKCWRGHSWGLNQSSALLLSPPSSSHSFKGIRVEPMSLNLFLFFSTHTFYTSSFFFFFSFLKKEKALSSYSYLNGTKIVLLQIAGTQWIVLQILPGHGMAMRMEWGNNTWWANSLVGATLLLQD